MNHKESIKIAKLEENQKNTEKKVDDIGDDVKAVIENHLPHIQKQISDLEAKIEVNKVKIALIVGAAAFLATIIANKLLERI